MIPNVTQRRPPTPSKRDQPIRRLPSAVSDQPASPSASSAGSQKSGLLPRSAQVKLGARWISCGIRASSAPKADSNPTPKTASEAAWIRSWSVAGISEASHAWQKLHAFFTRAGVGWRSRRRCPMASRASVLGLLFALDASPVQAAPPVPPDQISWSGVLVDGGGAPLAGAVDLTARLYDAPSGGTLLFVQSFPGVALSDGHYTIQLGP